MFQKLLRCHKLCLCGEKSFSVFNWFSIQHNNITCYGSSYISPYALYTVLFRSGTMKLTPATHLTRWRNTLVFSLSFFFPIFFPLVRFHSASRTFLSFAWFLRTLKSLCVNRLRSLLRMRCMLLGYRFEPMPNSPTVGSAGSVVTISYDHLDVRTREKKFDGRKWD